MLADKKVQTPRNIVMQECILRGEKIRFLSTASITRCLPTAEASQKEGRRQTTQFQEAKKKLLNAKWKRLASKPD